METSLTTTIQRATEKFFNDQSPDGYWWFTLEANESINAELIFLIRYMGLNEPALEQAICQRLISAQNTDGSWSLHHAGNGDLSTTIECYLALKLNGLDIKSECLTKAHKFILKAGGLSKCRVFTRIHLAMFGLIPWSQCPNMPIAFIHFPVWFPFNIYEFSSWARATIVPLLIMMDQKKTQQLPNGFLDELYAEGHPSLAIMSYNNQSGIWGSVFIGLDKFLGALDQSDIKPFRKSALKKCEAWIRQHIAGTEDIYPAMAYSAMALHVLGHPLTDPTIQKCLKGLEKFRITYHSNDKLPTLPQTLNPTPQTLAYQQCCISPVWDTPWMAMALLESGTPVDHPKIKQAASWLASKQITTVYGDWAQKNKTGKPGGWSFEFENDFFPDVDDTIEVLFLLIKMCHPREGRGPDLDSDLLRNDNYSTHIERGLHWLLSMQSDSGGWAAFDIDNNKKWVNLIPFSDHGACQDPPTPDITGRMLELLAQFNFKIGDPIISDALSFIEKTQEKNGSWEGRWGVNYLYGTWCILQGLQAIGYPMDSPRVQKTLSWLTSIQNEDGGFGESCRSYIEKKFVKTKQSVPSQTAWALMTLIAGGLGKSESAKRAANFLINSQKEDGSWDELYHTGTGFPGHFYIRYHGYRHYFPLLALGKFKKISN